MPLTPRQRMKVRKATKVKDKDPSEEMGELNIVPFLDIVVNLMLFLLATTAATMAIAETDVESPGICRGANCAEARDSMQLSVTVTASGPVIASREGRYDCDDELATCLAEVHERYPEEREVILSADPEIQYEALIVAMDAISESFPTIRLSAGVR